jgi:hypothetical protein
MEAANQQPNDWQQLTNYPNYDIQSHHPFLIRKRSNQRIIALTATRRGYIVCRIDGQPLYHHRVIADQFIPNPNNLPAIDHQNRIRSDNRLENLRRASVADNSRNKTSHKQIVYEFVDTLPIDAIELTEYGPHQFENLYYHNGVFYLFTGINYRILQHLTYAYDQTVFVYAYDTTNTQTKIYVAKYRRMINDLP